MPITYIRNTEGDYVCPHCGVTKSRQNTMYYHIKKHTGDLPHVCDQCPMKFLQKKSLELHIQAKHTTTPPTGRPKTLGEALKQRAAVAASYQYTCPFPDCNFKALSKGNCRIHIFRIHYSSQSQSYMDDNSCKLCNITFNSPTHYYYHIGPCMLAHTDHIFDEDGVEKYL